ncbi:hypothetical protein CFIMG_008633RA00001 [Ceratocystis fimbriata CBS 114723]|uniref:Uncharacterized protein n=1 Tax=Ceratocystis fimbriata CBS 114723 TaxID=1035309 RepID=A0A2C5XIK9_9PEZI|nr:hypothetical protein CFIMG_008633RA00001 [Ceratocystis fimbriata CBS 114723]
MCKYIRFIFSPSSSSSPSPRQLYDSDQFEPCDFYLSTGIECPKPIVSLFHPPIAPDSPSASGTSLASASYTHRRSSTLAVASASPRSIAHLALPNQTFASVQSPSRSPVSDNRRRHDSRSHHHHHRQSTSSKSNSAPHRSRDHQEASSHSQSKSHLQSHSYTSTGHRRLSTTAHIPRTIPEIPSSSTLPNMSSSKSSAQQHQPQQTSPSLSESRMRQSHQSGVNDKDSQHKKKRAASRTRARRQSVSPYSSMSEASDDEDDRHKQSIRHKLRREIARERERMQMKKTVASGSGSSGRSSSKVRHEDTSAEADEAERRAHRHSKQARFYETPLIFSDSDDEDTRQLRINARIAAHNREISRRPSHDSPSSTPSTTHTTAIVSSSRTQSPKSSTSSTKASKFKSTSKATANNYVRPNVEMTVDELVAADPMEYGSGARVSTLVDARRPRSTRQSAYDGVSWQQIQKKVEEEAMRERLKERFVPRCNQPQAW